MTTDKILAILRKVNSIKALKTGTEVKMEYGNETFATSVMPIEHIDFDEKRVYVNLFSEATRCKATDVCGLSEVDADADAENPIFAQQKSKIKHSSSQAMTSCEPNSGCC